MNVTVPKTLEEALYVLQNEPEADVLAGGTDFMVEVNYGHRRPRSVLSLRALDELRRWRREGNSLVLGAGIRYVDLLKPDLAALTPGLAQAARTVGSPQIRNCGTLGGNIATASPAGDLLPVLIALDACVTIASLRDQRSVPLSELIIGVKRMTLRDDELILSVKIPVVSGPQEFLKIGKRNAMVIAVASVALVVDLDAKSLACALGAVGPTVLRCKQAETMVVDQIDWKNVRIDDPKVHQIFGEMCGQAALPIDDHRSTADYRRHAISVLARRAIMRAF